MLSKNSTRLLIAALCVITLVFLGIYRFKNREAPTALPSQAVHLPTPAETPVATETAPTQTPAAVVEQSAPITEDSDESSPIPAFRQWAEMAAVLGPDQADQNKGMKLAKARAIEMKALIQKDPATAVREALPTNLRAALPPQIAAAIEQPVKKSGMCSMRITCNHSDDSPHGNCNSTPVLQDDVYSWDAHYGDPQWETLVGQAVEFEGVAVEEQLAVAKITSAPLKE